MPIGYIPYAGPPQPPPPSQGPQPWNVGNMVTDINGDQWQCVVGGMLGNGGPQAQFVLISAPPASTISAGLSIFGNGFAGDFTMDGTTSPPAMSNLTGFSGLNMSGPTTGSYQDGATKAYSGNSDMYFHDLTVNSGVAMFTEGDRLFVAGTLTLNGIVDMGPIASLSAAGSVAGIGTGNQGADPIGGCTPGTIGSTGVGGAGAHPTAYANTGATITARQVGGRGGAGGAGSAGAGGTAAANINVSEETGLPYGLTGALGFTLTAGGLSNWTGGSSGGSGAGDSMYAGGGSGAGGGLVVIFARFITGNGTIWSSGGNGGAAPVGSNAGGGGGGGGGGLIIVTQSAVWNGTSYAIPGITVAAPGGVGGAGVGSGSGGSAGASGTVIIIPG